jgi:site-specific recombinase XerD
MHSFDETFYTKKFNKFLDLRDLTKNTQDSYRSFLHCYLSWIDTNLHKAPEDVSFEELRSYILFLKNAKKLSNRTINAYISQLKFFYLYILNLPWNQYEIPFMKFYTKLPDVPSLEETLHFISSIPNLKHKACIALLYSSGLRVSELRHLRYEDIDRQNMRIYVRCSKTRSDRFVPLSSNALNILTNYWFAFDKPKGWLFPGTKQDMPIVNFTVTQFVTNHAKAINWNKPISPHMFRHAFATHLYEQGTDLIVIQKLLGHKSILSTSIYVHLAKNHPLDFHSPFDLGGKQ